jgi:hypothetical protein
MYCIRYLKIEIGKEDFDRLICICYSVLDPIGQACWLGGAYGWLCECHVSARAGGFGQPRAMEKVHLCALTLQEPACAEERLAASPSQ